MNSGLRTIERVIGLGSLLLLMVLPVLSTILRVVFRVSIPDGAILEKHLVLPLAFLGASMASAEGRHLGINFNLDKAPGMLGNLARAVPVFFETTFLVLFFLASIAAIGLFPEISESAWFLPLGIFLAMVPLGFLGILWARLRASMEKSGVAVVLGLALGLVLSLADIRDIVGNLGLFSQPGSPWAALDGVWVQVMEFIKPWLMGLVIASVFLGTPLFVVLGGVAALLYLGPGFGMFGDSMGANPVIASGYALITQDAIPAVALFTFAGYVLSASKTGTRLLELFSSLFGFIPGGKLMVVALVMAFFTTFTGASGITILALGGVFYAALGAQHKGHLGYITSSASLGLLFPPSLAVIVYGSVTLLPIPELFLGGLIPGIIMLIGTIIAGLVLGGGSLAVEPFVPKRAFQSLIASLPELGIPIMVAVLYFSGFATVGETAAWAALYVTIVEVFIRKEISVKEFWGVAQKALLVVGGVLIILGVARGLSAWLVENGVADLLAQWFQSGIRSPLVFILVVNGILLVAGCLMDMFSAILVIAPVLAPIAVAYGIDPIHFGVIFLSNLGVGFITPPVGINLFLSSFVFEKPLTEVYRSVLPFVVVQIVLVVLISYLPLLWY